MAVLSDADILRCLKRGDIAIEPFRDDRLTPNGYDVAVAEVLLPDRGEKALKGDAVVPSLARFAVSTEERIVLGPTVTAQLWVRTTWARRGVLASFGKIDAGFRGTLTLMAFNASEAPLTVPLGAPFAQVVFERLESAAESPYEIRSGHYQDQKGVRLR
jgi:dCTP deaminase